MRVVRSLWLNSFSWCVDNRGALPAARWSLGLSAQLIQGWWGFYIRLRKLVYELWCLWYCSDSSSSCTDGRRIGNWTELHCTEKAWHKGPRKITVHLKIASKISFNRAISARRRMCLSGQNPHLELRNESLCWHVGVDEVIVPCAHSRNSQILLLQCFVTNVTCCQDTKLNPIFWWSSAQKQAQIWILGDV